MLENSLPYPKFTVSCKKKCTTNILFFLQRERQDYLFQTLDSLLNNSVDEAATVHIVVIIAEANLTYVKETSLKINDEFADYVKLGKLQVKQL